MSRIEENVIKKIMERAETGLNKYGTTMERDDLSEIDWLIHLQEEVLDAAVYLEKIIELKHQTFELLYNVTTTNEELFNV